MKKYPVYKLLPVLFSFFIMGFVDVVGISVSYVKQDFALNDKLANLLPMMVFLWFAICSLPIGVFMRKVGRRKTVLLSAIITIIGMLIPMINYSFPIVLIAFALLGIGNTILQVSLNPLMSNVVDNKKITSMLTLGQFIKAISSALGPVLVGIAASTLGNWMYIFPTYATMTIISFVWLVFTPIEENKEIQSQSSIKTILSFFKDRYLLVLFSIIILIVGFEVGLLSTVPKFLNESFNQSLEIGGYACTLYFIARTIGTFGGSILLSKVSIHKFLIISMITGLLSLLCFILIRNQTMQFVSLFITGLSCANVFAIVFSNAIQYKMEFADEISAFMIVGVAGGAIIPPIMGVISDISTQQISLIVPALALAYILYMSVRVIKN